MVGLKLNIGAILFLLLSTFEVAQAEPQYIIHPAWSPDGETIAFYQRKASHSPIRAVDTDDLSTRMVTDGMTFDANPSFSPTGAQLVFSRAAPDMQGNWDIVTMDLATGAVGNLTQTIEREMHPQWSPDGKKISFVRFTDGQSDVFVIDLASGSETNITKTPDAREFHPKWRPDSAALVFDRSTTTGITIIEIELESGNQRALVTADKDERVSTPSYAPDARSVLVSRSQGSKDGIWNISMDGLSETAIFRIGDNQRAGGPVYSPDGSRIAFHVATDDRYSLYVVNADGTNLKPVVDK